MKERGENSPLFLLIEGKGVGREWYFGENGDMVEMGYWLFMRNYKGSFP